VVKKQKINWKFCPPSNSDLTEFVVVIRNYVVPVKFYFCVFYFILKGGERMSVTKEEYP